MLSKEIFSGPRISFSPGEYPNRFVDYASGVPALVVSDNLWTGVGRACHWKPWINATYDEMLAHEMIGDPTLADAILDRLVHNAYKIELKGESMRKTRKSLTQSGHSGT